MTYTVDVKGLHIKDLLPLPKNLTARFTSEALGETLSICDDEQMFIVPYRIIEDLAKKARGGSGE